MRAHNWTNEDDRKNLAAGVAVFVLIAILVCELIWC